MLFTKPANTEIAQRILLELPKVFCWEDNREDSYPFFFFWFFCRLELGSAPLLFEEDKIFGIQRWRRVLKNVIIQLRGERWKEMFSWVFEEEKRFGIRMWLRFLECLKNTKRWISEKTIFKMCAWFDYLLDCWLPLRVRFLKKQYLNEKCLIACYNGHKKYFLHSGAALGRCKQL
jgi:hypothetical protein